MAKKRIVEAMKAGTERNGEELVELLPMAKPAIHVLSVNMADPDSAYGSDPLTPNPDTGSDPPIPIVSVPATVPSSLDLDVAGVAIVGVGSLEDF